jgi:Protein of unknown function (DUF1360)
VLTTVRARARLVARRYAGDEPRPLAGYTLLVAGYTAAAGTLLLAARRRQDGTAGGLGTADLALTAVSTYRLSRLVTKDAVLSPLRAPLTHFTGPGGPAEVTEEVAPEVVGRPVLHALGELVTCPFCTGQWVATALVAGHVLEPRFTRLVTSVLTAATGAELLQHAHAALHAAPAQQ